MVLKGSNNRVRVQVLTQDEELLVEFNGLHCLALSLLYELWADSVDADVKASLVDGDEVELVNRYTKQTGVDERLYVIKILAS